MDSTSSTLAKFWIKRHCKEGTSTRRCIERGFYTRKASFVVYNKSHIYIGTSVHINELHLRRVYYTTVLEDLMKLRGIRKIHG
jgi:hypothetical protein